MSKAFVNEDAAGDADDERVLRRPAEPLPITPQGAEELRRELGGIDAASRRARDIEQILGTVDVRVPETGAGIGFGSRVEVRRADGTRRSYELVGPDEADPRRGRISVASPVARALAGKREGETASLARSGGDEEILIERVGG